METLKNVLCAVGGFGFGVLGAYINVRISARGVNADNVAAVMGTNALRMLIDLVTLGLCYLAIRLWKLPFMLTLIATALGLTVFGMIFLRRLVRSLDEPEKTDHGGE